MTKAIKGLAEIIDKVDLFLIDQYGVLHDGVDPYPKAVETLKEIKSQDKHIVIVSNSGKRSASNVSRVEKLGFSSDLFDHFVTSGEVAFRYLKSHLKGAPAQKCYLIARDNDSTAIDDLNLQIVETPEDADLIIISGSESDKYSEGDYRQLLKSAAQKNVMCLCTNPDKQMLTPQGLKFAAGRIGEIYEELGGEIRWIGKPFPAIYQYILTLYGDYSPERILCIGDSLEHDIAGGQGAQLKTLLVSTGILTGLSDDQVQKQIQQSEFSPDYIVPELCF